MKAHELIWDSPLRKGEERGLSITAVMVRVLGVIVVKVVVEEGGGKDKLSG